MIVRAFLFGWLSVLSGCYASHDPAADAGPFSSSMVTAPCTGGATGSGRDCGFRVERIASCAPGAMVTVSCGCSGLGTCAGDPVLRICRGASDCTYAGSVVNVDDSCGLCPLATFACPTEGRYTVLSAPYSSPPYTCTIEIE